MTALWKARSIFFYPVDSAIADSVRISSAIWQATDSDGVYKVERSAYYFLEDLVTYDDSSEVVALTQTEIFTDIFNAIPTKPDWMVDVEESLTKSLENKYNEPMKSSSTSPTDNTPIEI